MNFENTRLLLKITSSTVGFLLCFNIPVIGQLPSANFTTQSNACLAESIKTTNLSTDATQFIWDFCEGDLFQTPAFQDIGLISGSFNPKSIDISQSDNFWYGFITSKSTNSLFRVDFGDSLDNPTPTITNLGNIGDILDGPETIKIVNENGSWYAFIINGSSSTLIRLSYGTSLHNIPTSELVLSNISTFNSGFDIGESLNQKVLVASNFSTNAVTMVNFGSSYLNNPGPLDIIITSPITGAAGSGDIKVLINNGLWHGFLLTPNSKKIYRLDYGSDLFSIPTTNDITGTIVGTEFTFGIEIARDKGEFIGLIQTNSGKLLRVYFGDEIDNNSPTSEDLGNFGVLQNSNSLKLIKENSQWHAFTIDSPNKKLFGGSFPNICFTSPQTSTVENVYGINYIDPGDKYISLVALNESNEFSYKADSITISPSTAPQLTAQITGNCLSSPISFSGQELSGDINSWNWDFGDGTGTSTIQNDTYQYAASGSYQVRLNVTDVNGCNNLYIDTAQVYEEPIPSFSYPAGNLCMKNTVAFTNTTTGESGPVVSWTWDFNGEGTSTEKDPSFTFLTAGSKTVTLTSSIPGCANVTQQTITIEEAPTTAFSFENVCNGQTTTFTDLTTGSNLTSWNWDFGDGMSSLDQNPTHQYVNPGKYVVTLAVTNILGCTTTKVDTAYSHANPVVSFTYDLPCSSSPIQFSDQSTVQDANVVAWEWDFGDGNTSTDRNPEHVYGQTGDFTVQLKAYSNTTCVESVEIIISVIQGPEVNFEWDKSCVGESTTFTDLTNSFGLPITSWTWIIDGQIFNEQNPDYIFAATGSHPIELSVTTNNLCSQTLTKELVVDIPPSSSFGYFESCTDNSVTFFDTTPTPIASREWRIGGAVEGIDSTLVIGLAPANYNVTLITISEESCTGALTKEITITGSLEASFLASTNYGAAPLTVEFTNQSTGTSTYKWQFGDVDESTSIETNPQFKYTEIGTYNVILIAYGGENCSDTTSQTIEVVEPVHGFKIGALTPIDSGKIALSLSNLGSITYNKSNSTLFFTLDNGIEFTEPFNSILYPNKSMTYVPELTLGEVGTAESLCVKLEYTNGLGTEVLDENCISLTEEVVIASAYPNPAKDYINLSVVLIADGVITIKLIDSSGATILVNEDDTAQVGLNNYTIETTPYRSGLYIVKIEAEGVAKEMKVVIDK